MQLWIICKEEHTAKQEWMIYSLFEPTKESHIAKVEDLFKVILKTPNDRFHHRNARSFRKEL